MFFEHPALHEPWKYNYSFHQASVTNQMIRRRLSVTSGQT